jgi:hypothetical protein
MFPFFGGLPEAFIILALVAAVVRLVTVAFVRQQTRMNPSRQHALQESVTYRSTISARYRSPNRRLRPNHWYYPQGNPTEVVVHDTTFQISAWSFRRRGRHFGVFITSAQSSMWQSQMRFGPFGVMPCIVVAGSYPFRGQDRPIEIAMAPRGPLRDLWNALAASGVRVEVPNGSRGMAQTDPSIVTPAGPPVWAAPPLPSGPTAPSSASQLFQEPTGALAYRSGNWQLRRMLIIAGVVIIFFPIVISLILHAISPTRTTPASLIGSDTVATASRVSCVIGSDDLTATGDITAAAEAVNGLRITVQRGSLYRSRLSCPRRPPASILSASAASIGPRLRPRELPLDGAIEVSLTYVAAVKRSSSSLAL